MRPRSGGRPSRFADLCRHSDHGSTIIVFVTSFTTPPHRDETPLLKALRPAIATLARAHHHRDPYTCRHQERVAHFAASMGALLGLRRARLEIIYLAALVHDIGKLGIPAEIIGKPEKLSDAEYAIVQTHCVIGHDILQQLRAPFPIAEIVHQHHERVDGSGYPRGLRGEAILEEAGILAVADTYDAMSSYRPYRRRWRRTSSLENSADWRGTPLIGALSMRAFGTFLAGPRCIQGPHQSSIHPHRPQPNIANGTRRCLRAITSPRSA